MTAHTCSLCDWYTQEPREPVAQAQSTWHVYRKHPEAWRQIIGNRPRTGDANGSAGAKTKEQGVNESAKPGVHFVCIRHSLRVETKFIGASVHIIHSKSATSCDSTQFARQEVTMVTRNSLLEKAKRIGIRPNSPGVTVRNIRHLTECAVGMFPNQFSDDECTCWDDSPQDCG